MTAGVAAERTHLSYTIRPSSLRYFLEHQLRRVRSTWTATIVSAIAMPVFFLLTIGFGLGTQVDTAQIPADDFASFVGPGVLASAAVLQGGGLSLWPTMSALKWEGTYQAALSTPLTVVELATGHILFIGFRSLVSGLLYTAVLIGFGIPTSILVVLAPLVAALVAMSVAAPLSAFAATQETDNVFSLIMRLGLTPLFLFSGAFFPIEQLPDGVEWVIWLNPAWHGVELSRGFALGTIGGAATIAHLAVLLALALGGWLAAGRTFADRLAR